jgi:uncharacterized protein
LSFLLDVNLLIALVDSAHVNHEAAHSWFAGGRDFATCSLTENALVRILSNPSYPTVDATPAQAGEYLRAFREHPRHTSLPDDASLGDPTLFDLRAVAGSRQVSDVYLLGLAHRHGFRLATFDRRLSSAAVLGAPAALIELVSP